MDNPILCPYCGAEMTYQRGRDLSCAYANYYCPECYATSSRYYCLDVEHPENVAASAAQLARERNTPPQEPISYDDIAGTIQCIPCWIETPQGIWPDVLDEESEGYYGKLSAPHWYERQYFRPADYNKTWRCWATCPSDEERRNAPWCSTTSAPPET